MIQVVLYVLALIVCPFAYAMVVERMKAQVIDEPPVMPMFYLFGTLGGFLLAMALSPSGLAAMCMVFLMTVAPLVLIISSAVLCAGSERSIYHRICIWGGFLYAAALVLLVAVVVLTRK